MDYAILLSWEIEKMILELSEIQPKLKKECHYILGKKKNEIQACHLIF